MRHVQKRGDAAPFSPGKWHAGGCDRAGERISPGWGLSALLQYTHAGGRRRSGSGL